MTPLPDPEADTRWVLALYGATMLAVQSLENTVSWLYLLVDATRQNGGTRSPRRQWSKALARSWSAFQHATSRMKLNDVQRGIRDQLDPELATELDVFLAGPRAQLAHRFLVERLQPIDVQARGRQPVRSPEHVRFRAGTVHELLRVTLHANALNERLDRRAREILATLPDAPEAPAEVVQFAEEVARMAMFKEFPTPLHPPSQPKPDDS